MGHSVRLGTFASTSLAAILLVAPLAGASTRLDAGVAQVLVVDDRGDSCSLRIGPACQANATVDPTNPGHDSFDTHQRLTYVGVATNLGAPPVVGDQNVSVSGDSITVPDPVLPLVFGEWSLVEPYVAPYTNATLVSDDQAFYLRYWGPSFTDPTGPWVTHETGFAYAGPGESGFHQDSIGPFTNPAPDRGADTRNYFWGSELLACASSFTNNPTCHGTFQALDAVYNSTTPEIIWGADLYVVQVATDPHDLAPPPESD